MVIATLIGQVISTGPGDDQGDQLAGSAGCRGEKPGAGSWGLPPADYEKPGAGTPFRPSPEQRLAVFLSTAPGRTPLWRPKCISCSARAGRIDGHGVGKERLARGGYGKRARFVGCWWGRRAECLRLSGES